MNNPGDGVQLRMKDSGQVRECRGPWEMETHKTGNKTQLGGPVLHWVVNTMLLHLDRLGVFKCITVYYF